MSAKLSVQLTNLAARRARVRRIFVYGVVWPLVAFCAAALFMPGDIFDRVPALEALTSHVAAGVIAIFPKLNIAFHAKSTSFPQVAMLMSAFAMLLVPWLVCAAWIGMLLGYSYGRKEKNPFQTFGLAQLLVVSLMIFFGGPLGMWVLHIFYAVAGDPTLYAGVTTRSRLGYALLSTSTVVLASGCIWMQPVYFVMVVDKLFFGGFKNVPDPPA